MKNVEIRWLLGCSQVLVLGASVVALSACDVSVGHCKKDDAGECVDLFPDDDGGQDDEDGGALDGGRSDAGKDAGGDAQADGSMDAGASSEDGGDAGDAGSSSDSEVRDPLTIREFCEAALAPGQAWADKMDECCSSAAVGSAEHDRLLALFGSPAGGASDCEDRQQALIDSGNVTFDGKYAAACADAIAANYDDMAPPADCPSGDGYFLPEIEAMVGHGAQAPQQIPVCRKAFVGKLAAATTCTSDWHCSDNRVCRAGSGGQTCQDPVPEGGTCDDAFDCAYGTTCVGNDSSGTGGKRCIATDDLGLNTAKCTRSAECIVGLVCDGDTKLCTQAPAASDYKAGGASCDEAALECRGFCDTSSNKCAAFCVQ
jgi:hypothetical protein